MTTTPKVWRATQQANFTDAGDQSDPQIVDIGSGRYVVVWTEAAGGPIATAPGSDLVGQIFDARGNRIGTEFRANFSFSADNEQNAALDTRPAGGFVMLYTDTDAAGTSIRAQSYDVNGSLVGGAPATIQADTSTDTLSSPALAVRSNGSYLVTYGRSTEAGGPLSTSTVGRIVSAAGAVGSEFTIADAAVVGATFNTDVDVLSNGNYVVVYEHQPGFGAFAAAYQIRDSTGAFVRGGDFGGPLAFDVHVAALTGGSFVTVWTEEDGDAPVGGSSSGIAARVDNGAGTPATFLIVNTFVAGDQVRPDVAALNDGGFVVTWLDNNLGLVRGQRFDAAGTKVGVEFTAGDMGSEANPVVASLGDGRFAVDFAQISGDDDIWATIFDPRTSPTVNFPSPFCDFDDEGKSDILWQNSDGTPAIWLMDGMSAVGIGPAGPFNPGPSWQVKRAGDFNGDGNSDILWQNSDGTPAIWLMDGMSAVRNRSCRLVQSGAKLAGQAHRRLQRRRQVRHPVAGQRWHAGDLADGRHECGGDRCRWLVQSRAELAGQGRWRLQRRRQVRHPMAGQRRHAGDLADGRHECGGNRSCRLVQSGAKLADQGHW